MPSLLDLQTRFYVLTDPPNFSPRKGYRATVAAIRAQILALDPTWEPVAQFFGGGGGEGPAGPPGEPGTKWFTGDGAPAVDIGSNGDLYLDRIAGNVYQKESGTWA